MDRDLVDISKFWNLKDFDKPMLHEVYDLYFKRYGQTAHNGMDDGKKYICMMCESENTSDEKGFIQVDYSTGHWHCSKCIIKGGVAQAIHLLMDISFPEAVAEAGFHLDILPKVPLGVYRANYGPEEYLVMGVGKDNSHNGEWRLICREMKHDFRFVIFSLQEFFIADKQMHHCPAPYQFVRHAY